MPNHYSVEIFTIASECGLPFRVDDVWPVSDDAFLSFKTRYLEWSNERDRHLREYLSTSSQLFRVYVPYNERVFHLASQIVWYLDEIIIRDPLRTIAEKPQGDIEYDKVEAIQLLQFLYRFHSALSNGYILFAGPQVLESPDSHVYSTIAKSLLELPEIHSALQQSTYYGCTTRKDSGGRDTALFQLKLDSGGIIGWGHLTIGGAKSVSAPAIRLGETLPPATFEDVQKVVSLDLNQMMRGSDITEIERTLALVDTASDLGAAIIFDRQLDQLILENAGVKLSDQKQVATCGVLDVSLPFIKGIPPERIADIREKMPMAFLDFRAKLRNIVSEGLKSGIAARDELQRYVQEQVAPNLNLIDSEINGSLKKAKILYLGCPLLSGFGILTGAILSAPVAALIGVGVVGAFTAVKAFADDQETKEKAKGHPFYFLWRITSG